MVMAKVLVPRAPFGGGNGKTKVELAFAIVRWNYSSGGVHRLKSGIASEEEKYLIGSYAQRRKAVVPGNLLEPEKSLVKFQGAFQVRHMHRCFTNSAY